MPGVFWVHSPATMRIFWPGFTCRSAAVRQTAAAAHRGHAPSCAISTPAQTANDTLM